MTSQCDVAIVGGAFAGAATALLLRRETPGLSIAILERSADFDRKVGEATTEVSGAFLTKRLGLTHHLTHHHVVKNGLRFWFVNPGTRSQCDFDTAGELGPSMNVRLPTYQVDREILDDHILQEAVNAGASLHRPAKVRAIQTAEESQDGLNHLIWQDAEGEHTLKSRWIVDASGKVALLARSKGLLQPVPGHPTSALWCRMRNVADLDSWEMRERYPAFGRCVQTSRSSATNHLTGHGWWCWIIPLKGGDTSVGLVYDERLFQPPDGANIGERLMAHLRSHPLGRILFSKSQPVEGDTRAYSKMPYHTSELAGPGWQLVGDAAGFMDPLYSSGLDYGSWTVSAAVQRIQRESAGETVDLKALNQNFLRSYHGWMRGIYLDKYEYLGDRKLMTAAYLLDLGLFFFGPVREITGCARKGFAEFPFAGLVDGVVARIMAFYNARLVELARQKQRLGTYGSANEGFRTLVPGFTPTPGAMLRALDGAALWAMEEISMLRHRILRHPASSPISTVLPGKDLNAPPRWIQS